jgi:hypothetical protein
LVSAHHPVWGALGLQTLFLLSRKLGDGLSRMFAWLKNGNSRQIGGRQHV